MAERTAHAENQTPGDRNWIRN